MRATFVLLAFLWDLGKGVLGSPTPRNLQRGCQPSLKLSGWKVDAGNLGFVWTWPSTMKLLSLLQIFILWAWWFFKKNAIWCIMWERMASRLVYFLKRNLFQPDFRCNIVPAISLHFSQHRKTKMVLSNQNCLFSCGLSFVKLCSFSLHYIIPNAN